MSSGVAQRQLLPLECPTIYHGLRSLPHSHSQQTSTHDKCSARLAELVIPSFALTLSSFDTCPIQRFVLFNSQLTTLSACSCHVYAILSRQHDCLSLQPCEPFLVCRCVNSRRRMNNNNGSLLICLHHHHQLLQLLDPVNRQDCRGGPARWTAEREAAGANGDKSAAY